MQSPNMHIIVPVLPLLLCMCVMLLNPPLTQRASAWHWHRFFVVWGPEASLAIEIAATTLPLRGRLANPTEGRDCVERHPWDSPHSGL